MRVLVVEDEPGVAAFIEQGLTEAGYAVDRARDGEEGLDYALAADYDLLVLDIMLPRKSGLHLLKELRAGGNETPVLLLTARDAVEDKIKGLDAGADDYLVKPFAFSELLARLRALLRRPPLQNGTILLVSDLEMNSATRQVTRAGLPLELTPREYALLEYLMRHANQVLTRTQIAEHVWNFNFAGDTNVVDVYIGYLRRKIDGEGALPLIHTIRGVGYQLGAEHSGA
ncbi:MAG: response regulator transcription factor [Ardenticatenales bacterium]|nr:response regulator transcription factor [Ardenticatenales bacterium]